MKFLKILYVQVVIGIVLGVVVGLLWPNFGASLKVLGDAFIKMIKLIIAPVIFCTVAAGIAHMSDIRRVGRIGGKALIYFEVVSTFALLVGLAAGLLVKPGAGFGIDPATLDPAVAAGYAKRAAEDTGFVDHLLQLIPDTFAGAFANGDLLQVLFLAVLTGFAATRLGDFGARVAQSLDAVAKLLFSIIHIIVRFAPLGAFGAMAFTVGKYGIGSLTQLITLIVTVYGASILFVLVVLGAIARLVGFSLLKFLKYLREELLIVFGACSSEAALPQLLEKLERLGASKSVVGLVVPTGYSFNLDGGNIYMTLAFLFLAQATNTHLTAVQLATLVGVSLITSKGTAGVTGAGFVTLAATLAVVPDIPIASLALLVGVDRFMAECRGVTNFIGNAVAGLAVAKWERQLDMTTLQAELNRGPSRVEAEEAISIPTEPAAVETRPLSGNARRGEIDSERPSVRYTTGDRVQGAQMRADWRAVGRFLVAAVAAAAVGSGLLTAIMFLPVMEWLGSNSSAADAFVLGSIEIGIQHVATIWRDMFLRTLLGVVLVWSPIYLTLLRPRRANLMSILIIGAGAAFVVGLISYVLVLTQSLLAVSRQVYAVAFDPMYFLFGLRAATVAAGVGLMMTLAFHLFVGVRRST